MTARPQLRSVRTQPPIVAGRVPPHDLDAEAAVISCVMLGRGLHVLEVLEARDFYSDANGRIWDACVALSRSGIAVDPVTVASWLRDREQLAHVGGAAYVAQLVAATPAVANVNDHARIVLDHSRVRRTVAECQTIAAEGYGDVGEVSDWLQKASERVHSVTSSGGTKQHVRYGDALAKLITSVRADAEGVPHVQGLGFGLADVDALTGGMLPGDLTILAAPKKAGKSTLALCAAAHVASTSENVVGRELPVPNGAAVFSLEMKAEEAAGKIAAAIALVDYGRIRKGLGTPNDYVSLCKAHEVSAQWPIDIDDDAFLTVARLRAKVKRIEAEQADKGIRLRLVVVDYLQLVDPPEDMRGPNVTREQQVGAIGKRLRQLTKEMSHLSWLVLSQVNKDGELRESGALEQHAVNVWILHSPEPKDWDGSEPIAAQLEVKISRWQRKGQRAPCWYHPQFSLFSDEERPTR